MYGIIDGKVVVGSCCKRVVVIEKDFVIFKVVNMWVVDVRFILLC